MRIQGLYAEVNHIEPTHIDEQSGLYTGRILSMSDTIVQQDDGGGKVIYHDASKLDRLPWLGEVHSISYKDGIGTVSAPSGKCQ